jgi:rod shape determining protein RodA
MKKKEFNLHLTYRLDFALLLSAVTLTVFGILFIRSSGFSAGVETSTQYYKQIIWGSIGLVIALILSQVNYRRIYYITLYIYIGTLVVLLYTCFFGKRVNGARAWLAIGGLGIQPSEFAKLATILCLAQYLDYSRRFQNGFKRFFVSCLIVGAPMLVVLLQPDFGTSLVFVPILLMMTFVAGIKLRYIFFIVLLIACTGTLVVLPFWQEHILKRTIPLLQLLHDKVVVAGVTGVLLVMFAVAALGRLRFRKTYFYYLAYAALIMALSVSLSFAAQKVLKEYQINRLVVFIDPNVDPRGAGWNIIQSVTAIGAGGLKGKGYLQGTQSHYRFLPQQSTDFIFSIFSEESGFIGGMIVFACFLIISLRLLSIMKKTQDPFGVYIVAGLSAMYIFHFIINVGMTMGIMPITGIPLLFMSYGGSALLSALIGIGLALSVYVRRFQY